MRRATVSIIANLAEGASRKSEKDFHRFLQYSLGSAFELEVFIELSQDLNFIDTSKTELIISEIKGIQKRLTNLMLRLKN